MGISGISGRLLVALLLVAAGCGGDDNKSAAGTTTTIEATTTTSPPTTATTAAPATIAPAPTTTTKPNPTTTATTAPAKLSPTQFIVAKPGCKNEIDYVRVGADRKVVQSKVIVKAAGNSQLIAYGERDDNLLFGAFNCDANTTSISEIALTNPKGTPKVIASDLRIVDADYDIKSKAVLVLVSGQGSDPDSVVSIDPAGTRTVRWTRPVSWNTAASPLGGFMSPNRIKALTGGEMMIGAYRSGDKKFLVFRVSEDGSMSGGVTGDGQLNNFALSILQGAIAISVDGSPDLYICAFSPVYGTGQPTPKPITSVPGCAANPMPEGLTSLGPKVAWAFSG